LIKLVFLELTDDSQEEKDVGHCCNRASGQKAAPGVVRSLIVRSQPTSNKLE